MAPQTSPRASLARAQRAPTTNLRRATLPAELIQAVLRDSSLSKKDVAQVRRANRWAKGVVDQAVLPQFRLPTTYVGPSTTSSRSTVGDYFQAKPKAHARAVMDQCLAVLLGVGQNSLLLTQRPAEFLLRCGNGRLLLAALYGFPSLFAEVAPAGALLPTDTLLAATPSKYPKESWRLLIKGQSDQTGYLCRIRSGGRLVRQELPSPLQVPPPFDKPKGPIVFSAGGSFLVEPGQGVTRRYFLGDGSMPIDCLATLHGGQPATLCASTGRRFTYQGTARNSVAIYEDAWAIEPSKEVFLGKLHGKVYGVSVAPDGNTFALLSRKYIYEENADVALVAHASYDVPEGFAGRVPCKYAQEMGELWYRGDQHQREGSWYQCAKNGWQLMRRELIQTTAFDYDTTWRLGLQDEERLTSLSVWPESTTDLLWLSKLVPLGDHEAGPSTVSSRQRLYHHAKHTLVWLDGRWLTKYMILPISLVSCVSTLIPRQQDTEVEKALLWACVGLVGFTSLIMVSSAIGRRVLKVRAAHAYSSPKTLAAQLQAAPLPAVGTNGR